MKISKIKIQNFKQFKNFEIDLTYPKGHAKEGQPLDKVCIIGQNGTGKTTLLDIIDDFYIKSIENSSVAKTDKDELQVFLNFLELQSNTSIELDYLINNEVFKIQRNGIRWSSNCTLKPDFLLYLPFGINSKQFSRYNDRIKDETIMHWEKNIGEYFFGAPELVVAFEKKANKNTFDYNKKRADNNLLLISKVQNGEELDLRKELKIWEEQNPNPLVKIGEYLDKLLNRFYLKTKTSLESTDEIYSIQLESLSNGETIKFDDLSSGTKQILNAARPIHDLLKEDSIVLIDEPETSLYPDLQKEIIPYYLSLREDLEGKVQYFFATHSPIIASEFDPWEIIDLEFDEQGNVFRHLYYEGENHIDNYTIFPKYLRWDSILNRVFDVKESGNSEREDAIFEIAELNTFLEYCKNEGLLKNPSHEVIKKIERYKILMEKLDWKTTNNDNL